MKILVLGAGQVGSTLAELLVTEGHDVTLVDSNPERLSELQSHLDIRTLCGCASLPSVLQDAGASEADMLIAVTNQDETNMIACQVAYSLFRTPQKIARIRASQYLNQKVLFQDDALPIDVLIGPEQLVCDHIQALIEYPDALQVLTFTHEHLIGMAVSIEPRALAANRPPEALPLVAQGHAQVGLVIREDAVLVPRGEDFRLMAGDEVYIVTTRAFLKDFLSCFRKIDTDYERVIIGGGGNIGLRLAKGLESNFHVKIIDHCHAHSDRLANSLQDAIVLHGEVSDKDLLLSENIDKADVFCAVTNAEEVNIMSALLAKHLGAHKVMALVNNPAYLELLRHNAIDTLISPKQATVSSILSYIRRGDVIKAHALLNGAEAMEAVAHGTMSSSRIIGRKVSDIPWPRGVHLAAIIRRNEQLFNLREVVIKAEDHLILFIADKSQIPETEALFQVNVNYL